MHIQQQQHPLSPHTAVIEIVTYDGDGDLGLDHFAARLKLVFSDVDMPNHPGAMQTKQAQQIVDFLNSFEDIDTIITSCEAG
ncbi:MAG: hypothetical protein LBN34_07185, partial [Clostridiales Family XIII bacterium]|nr:hypothetical protein [Clostridiales Family XIII bacterium]